MKNNLSLLYLEMLKMGFIILKEASRSGSNDWMDAELELLHNIPSLIEDKRWGRHLYFWNEEREYYLEKLKTMDNPDARSRCATYYEPIWEKMKEHFES